MIYLWFSIGFVTEVKMTINFFLWRIHLKATVHLEIWTPKIPLRASAWSLWQPGNWRPNKANKTSNHSEINLPKSWYLQKSHFFPVSPKNGQLSLQTLWKKSVNIYHFCCSHDHPAFTFGRLDPWTRPWRAIIAGWWRIPMGFPKVSPWFLWFT